VWAKKGRQKIYVHVFAAPVKYATVAPPRRFSCPLGRNPGAATDVAVTWPIVAVLLVNNHYNTVSEKLIEAVKLRQILFESSKRSYKDAEKKSRAQKKL
jgi:hypothetical protein